jgi:3-oxoacyl-[acyl-carrier protein] reductase
MDLQLTGKAVLVTGASRGIGLAAAKLFAHEGASVFICARDHGRLREAAESIDPSGARVRYRAADVTEPGHVENLIEQVDSDFGRLDVLVNNVGSGVYKPFLELTEDDLKRIMEANFFSHFRVTQRALRMMLREGGGSIVNVAGASGVTILDHHLTLPVLRPRKLP